MDLAKPAVDLPIIDETRLMEEFGDMPEILVELRDLFLEHAPPLFEAITQGAANNDEQALIKAAHSLKGACSTYGAPRLAQSCKEIELAAKAQDMTAIRAYMGIFEEEYLAVCENIGKLGVS